MGEHNVPYVIKERSVHYAQDAAGDNISVQKKTPPKRGCIAYYWHLCGGPPSYKFFTFDPSHHGSFMIGVFRMW